MIAVLGSGKVSFPGSETYNASLSSYFSQQEAQVQPLCIVTPANAQDVSVAIKTLTADVGSSCPFAVRSGGHCGFAGAANIAGGVTLDLSSLKDIEVSADRTTVSVGPGATWGDVYAAIEPLSLMVAGGRAGQVGVGGLVTGGGISFFSPRYGWTCDTVSNFEVALADGTLVNTGRGDDAAEDLHTALRGGSNNFGLVTRVDLEAFEQGQVWGGTVYHDLSTIDEQLRAFSEFSSAPDYDEYASLIMSFGFASGRGSAVVNNVEYTKAVENPPVFAALMGIPSLYSTVRLTGMTDLSKEQGSMAPGGLRQLSAVTTHGTTVGMLKATYTAWSQSLSVVEGIAGIVWSISLEPLPRAIYGKKAGSNALGLEDRSGPLVVALLSATWTSAEDDSAVEEAARDLFDAIEKEARRLGEYDSFVYLNYAAPWQKPLESYGEQRVELLKKVRQEVDPNGVFTRQVPGGFKLTQ